MGDIGIGNGETVHAPEVSVSDDTDDRSGSYKAKRSKQAEHMGISTCWTGWYDQQEMRDLLGLDERCYVIGVVTVGYSDAKPEASPRRELEYRVL